MFPQASKTTKGNLPFLIKGKAFILFFTFFLAFFVIAQAAETKKPLPQPYRIVTTCGMVTDIATQVAGDHANVMGLMGEGVDPHLYKPTRDDVNQLLKANVVFYSGLMLEGRMTDTFLKLARRGIPVYPVTELIEEKYLLEPEEFQGHWDPHVWMDVQAWSQAVKAIAQALSEIDPEHAADYQQNAATYQKQLAQLHQYTQQAIASIPTEARILITAHDAFNYFGRAYGIDVRGIQGLSTESEAGVDDINQLVDLIVTQKIPAVFVETSVSDKHVQAIIEGAKSRGWQVSIGGTLFSDAMGAPGTYEGTYVGMVDHNATTIARALGGVAPQKGMQRQLKAPSNPTSQLQKKG